MQHYPIDSFKKAYRTGDLQQAYQKDWDTLTNEWHVVLDAVETDSVDQQVARRIFGRRSLFEKECPHVVSDFATAHDNYRLSMANEDTAQALHFLDRAFVESDSAAPIKTEWSYQNLINGQPQKVEQVASIRDTTVDLQLLYADAFAMTQEWDKAVDHLSKGKQLFTENPDSLLRPAIETRNDSLQWKIYRDLTYRDILPDSAAFVKILHRTKIRSIRKAIKQERWNLVEKYGRLIARDPFQPRYFDDYQKLVHHLAFQRNDNLVKRFIKKLSAMPLRDRYRERLQQERRWLEFISNESIDSLK
jgi:hypothetical protein